MTEAMVCPVIRARSRSLVTTTSKVGHSVAISPPASRACSRPRVVRGGSAWPCQRPLAFHSLWPCLRTKIRVRSWFEGSTGTTHEGSAGTLGEVATLRLFAQAREVAGTSSDTVDGATVDEVIANAVARYGQNFANLLPTCRIWLNGEAVPASTTVSDKDEVAVLPPVSGGFE